MRHCYVRLEQINDTYYCSECPSLKCELNKKIKHCDLIMSTYLTGITVLYDLDSKYTYFHAHKDDDYIIITSLCHGIIDETIYLYNYKLYLMNGKIHRIDGPAVLSIGEYYYFRGMYLSKSEYDKLIKNYNLYNNIIKEFTY